MSVAYWVQWGRAELMSTQGAELEDYCGEDIDFDVDREENKEDCEGCCKRCIGAGCNYCLMCEW